MPTLEELAFEAEQDIGRTKAFFPIPPRLGNHWAATRPWAGETIALDLHLTTLTAAFLKELALGGATCVVTDANPGTTDPGAVQLLRNAGLPVYTGGGRKDHVEQLFGHAPTLLVDTDADLIDAAMQRSPDGADIKGAIITTRSGIEQLRSRGPVPFPIVDLTSGRLHDAVENRHGIGEAVWQAVTQLTGMHLAGRRAAVIGYGPVGKGLSAWARQAGMVVEVVETDPIRRLFAHYDGFVTPSLRDALTRVQVVVTATGRSQVVSVEDVLAARPGVVLVNAGTGGHEVDVAGLEARADVVDHVDEDVVQYRFEGGRSATVLGGGHPLNIVLNSGSPEPVLLHYAVLGLTLQWMADSDRLRVGEHTVPPDVELRAAELALAALGDGAGPG